MEISFKLKDLLTGFFLASPQLPHASNIELENINISLWIKENNNES